MFRKAVKGSEMLYDLLKKCVSIVFNIVNLLLGGKLPPFGSAGVIVENEGRYLVVTLPHGKIVFPGGFMTWQEHPRQAAAHCVVANSLSTSRSF